MRVPLAEETMSVLRRDVVTGQVRVTTRVETEEHFVETDVNELIVEVVRVPIDRMVDAVPAIRTEGDVTIIPIVEEVAVVETRLVLREEVHLRRHTETRNVSVPVTLRRLRADVEREVSSADEASARLEDPVLQDESRSSTLKSPTST